MKTTEVKSFADVDTSELKQPIICVFNKPDDYPDKYVARLFEGTYKYYHYKEHSRRNPGRYYKALPGYAAFCEKQGRP